MELEKQMMSRVLIGLIVMSGLLLQGCANTARYDRDAASSTTETGIGSAELRIAAEELANMMLADDDIDALTSGSRPVMAVFGVIDFTGDDLDLAGINSNLLNKLNQSGRFRFANADELVTQNNKLGASLYDLVEQPTTASRLADSMNADLLLVGEVTRIIRNQPTRKQIFYRVGLKLLDASSGEFVWSRTQELLRSEKAIIYGI